MPVKKVVTIGNFTRGLNTTREVIGDPNDGEFSTLLNHFLLDGRIRLRMPMVGWPILDVSDVLLDTGITNVIALTLDTGSWALIGMHPRKLSNINLGGVSAYHTDPMSLAPASSFEQWHAIQYMNYGYAVRSNLNYILRFNSANIWSNGIAIPSTLATLADGAAGNVEAGDYYGVFTFVDADGHESNPSPISAKLTHAAAKKIDWASVDVSTNPRVTARNLYRTLPNQTGEYFFVHQIADNTTTTATEDCTVPNMGALLETDNDVPPTENYLDIETAFERIWATDGRYVYGSKAENADAFPPENVYAFGPDDGQPITALKRRGTDLMVVKTGSVWALNQTMGEFEFVPRLVDDKNGSPAPASVCTSDGLLFFFSGKAVFQCDGRSPAVDVSSGRIAMFGNVSPTIAEDAVAAIYPRHGWYIIGFPGSSGGETSGLFVYDYRRRYWFQLSFNKTFSGPGGSIVDMDEIVFLRTVLDSDGQPRIFAGFYSSTGGASPVVFDLTAAEPSVGLGDLGGEAGYSFDSLLIPSTFTIRGIDLGAPGLQHSIDRILVACNDPRATLGLPDTNASLFTAIQLGQDNGRFGLGKTRSNVSVLGNHTWKNMNISAHTSKSNVDTISFSRLSRHECIVEAVQIHGHVWNHLPKGQ